MRRMRRAIERDGLPFRGFRTLPDGSVEALVGPPLTAEPNTESSAPSIDAEIDDWAAKHGYG